MHSVGLKLQTVRCCTKGRYYKYHHFCFYWKHCQLLSNLYYNVHLIDLMGVDCTSHNWFTNLKINRINWCYFVMQFAHISNTRILKETLSNKLICLIDCSITYFMVVNKYCNIMRFLHFCFFHSKECNFQYLDRCILLLVIRKGQRKNLTT